MDIAECTLNGERYHAARFARLGPKKLAELRQYLRCPDERCHAKAQFRKATVDGKAPCFAASHTAQCTVEAEFPSLSRAAPATKKTASNRKAGRAKSTGPANRATVRPRSGLGKPVLGEEAVPARPAAAALVPDNLPARDALTVHIATPSAVAYAQDDEEDRVPLVPAVIEVVLSARLAGESALDPLQFWASKRGERVAGLPRFDLTSLATRLAEDPSIAKLPSIVMASGVSGFELREFLRRTDTVSRFDVGRRRAYWGPIERLRQAGGGLYLDSGNVGVLLSAETVTDLKARRVGLSDEAESWLGALLLVVGEPMPGEGERLLINADLPDKTVVITDSAPASDTLPLAKEQADEGAGDSGAADDEASTDSDVSVAGDATAEGGLVVEGDVPAVGTGTEPTEAEAIGTEATQVVATEVEVTEADATEEVAAEAEAVADAEAEGMPVPPPDAVAAVEPESQAGEDAPGRDA